MKNPKSILITGGSSGLGEALALDYATEGVTLFLSGRNADRLDSVMTACEEKGASVYVDVLDSADEAAMSDWMIRCDKVAPLDLVIANAGIAEGFGTAMDLGEHTKRIFEVNVGGVLNTVHPAIRLMQPRGKGQIALMASLAGYHGLPTAPAYSTSKVCVKAYGEALRGVYFRHGIEINVICPGFVKTRITGANNFPMPFLMNTDKAVRIMRKGLDNNKARIAFPWQLSLILGAMVRFLPESLFDRLFRIMPKKT